MLRSSTRALIVSLVLLAAAPIPAQSAAIVGTRHMKAARDLRVDEPRRRRFYYRTAVGETRRHFAIGNG